jgi:ABC-type antimicrobial peptide transport system permease subunit
MIRKITLLVTVLSIWTSVNGQVSKFEIGLEGGPSLTSLRGNDILENFNDPTIGYSGGVTFQYNFPKPISIRTNITYERKGVVAKLNATDINGNPVGEIKTHSNFDYLTVPLLVRLNFGSRLKLFVNAGPYFGYLIKHTSVTEAFNEFPKSTTDNTGNFKRFDVGLTGGLGCGLPLKSNFIMTIEVRHNLGLYNTSELPIGNDGTIMTNSINLLLGVAYRFGTRINEKE